MGKYRRNYPRPVFKDKEKEAVFLKYKGKCFDCPENLRGYWHTVKTLKQRIKQTFTIDNGNIHHIIPISDGGKHCMENWMLLCIECHKIRHGKKKNNEKKNS